MATLKVYLTYSFVEKDPVIDELRTMRDRAKMTNKQIAEKSGLSPTTLHGWFDGRTRRPQSASIEAAGRAMGWRRGWVRIKEPAETTTRRK